MPATPQWKIIGTVFAFDVGYLVLLLVFFWLTRNAPISRAVFAIVPVLYFAIPAALNIGALFLFGILSRSTWLRILSLTAWSLVLPWIATSVAIFGGMYACHLNVIPNCLPY